MTTKIYDNWHYQKDENDSSHYNDPLIIIRNVCDLMLEAFDENPDTFLLITDDKQRGYPICLDNNMQIYLSTAGNTYWAQNAYQLSHELCHHFIKKKTPIDNNSWFEESICELASIYFLSKTASLWSNSTNAVKLSYSSSITEYISKLFISRSNIDLKQLSIQSSALYKEMNADPYLRDNNNYIAIKLLPIFKKNPSLWGDIYLIRELNIKDLNTFFTKWSQLAKKENVGSILEISELFL
ncbi:hypothetical protein [Lysinibacillus irui]|uniref:hypothetical protein n=1 Tax=Lysinibacillus irui TaxID=2998077 RepID=UPI002AD35C7C|nr:hypothetical protein [Lysinibacillus irui]MEA0563265.1 hypothetical protein [Lysinibacillus irui]